MGQYHKVFNLDAMQKLYPRASGDSIKLMEFGTGAYGTLSALALLLAKGTGHQGPWAGQRIVVSGDYADEGRFVPESHAGLTLQAYDYRADEEDEDAEEYVPPKPERFAEAAEIARNLGIGVLPEDHPFLVKNRSVPGIEKLLNDASIFMTPEDMFDAFGVRVCEDLRLTHEAIQYSIRCGDLVSKLAWDYQPQVAGFTENSDKDRVEQLTVTWRRGRGDEGPYEMHRELNFPATSIEVREFFGIEGYKPSRI